MQLVNLKFIHNKGGFISQQAWPTFDSTISEFFYGSYTSFLKWQFQLTNAKKVIINNVIIETHPVVP